MADSENPEVLNALVRLMKTLDDPSVLTETELVAAAKEARETKKTAELAVAVELAKRGWSWRRIGTELSVDHTTAYGWARDAGALPAISAALKARRDDDI